MVDVLLSLKPNYFKEMVDGEWYRETFSVRKSYSLDVVLETIKLDRYYLMVRSEKYNFQNFRPDKVIYVYILRQNYDDSLSEFKVHVDKQFSGCGSLKKILEDNIKPMSDKIIKATMGSKFSKTMFNGTKLMRRVEPLPILVY